VPGHPVSEEDRGPEEEACGDTERQREVEPGESQDRGDGEPGARGRAARVRPREGDDEREEIDRERQHPEERDGCDLLRQVAGHRRQHHRREEGECHPRNARERVSEGPPVAGTSISIPRCALSPLSGWGFRF